MKRYWVTMEYAAFSDKRLTDGKITVLALKCEDEAEADMVAWNGRNNPETANVKIWIREPKFNPDKFAILYKEKDDFPEFYKEGSFKKKKQ